MSMLRTPLAVITLAIITSLTSTAQFDPRVVFDAMRTEMQRSMTELHLGDLPRPYHMEYLLQVRRSVNMHAVLGTIENIDTGIVARLTVRVRVGGPVFDNTNFFDVSLGFFGSSDDEEGFRNRRIPFEVSAEALRRELWLATDACYKQAVEIFAKKQSSLKNRTRKDTTEDYSLMPGRTTSDVQPEVRVDIAQLSGLITDLSAVFRDYPAIHSSRVGLEVIPEETFYLSSEGMQMHKSEVTTGVEVITSTQAPDGMPLAQTYAAYGFTPRDLPTRTQLMADVRRTAETLARQTTAPTIEAYSGPVLFEGQAAGALLGQHFAPYLIAQRAPLSEGGFSTNDRSMAFQNKIGARVMPEFLSVSDLPTTTNFGGRVAAGSYRIDDEAMDAQNVNLVDKGYLRTLLSSRVPTKRIKVTNGHQRGGGAMFSVLDVSTKDVKKQLSPTEMKKRLLKLVKDRDLPYGIVVRTAMDQNLLFTGVIRQLGNELPVGQGEGKLGLLETYRVYPDGREELIRGVEAAGIAPALFKDILAVSTSTTVHNFLAPAVIPSFITGGSSYLISTIHTPDLLLEDVEIRPLEGDMPKPPAMASPME
ncbi:MAG: metallopeptidase TldD-related protein [Bacteroidota bacterium]